ncbi:MULTISPECIES: hypothetical protein [unclassified Cryobacterium]|uniref:hypothetical protein n=1 Tax=unclassified Cryobacterium TaxID=2649013 RepID=UPI00144792B5|nr:MULTISPECIES: hypothetical protein [unclassified Cryobacterium]
MNSENALPLRFNPPLGWPTPSEEWLVGHLGWEPPVGWIPRQGLIAAPPGWAFWTKNETAWSPLAEAVRAAAWKSFWIGAALFVGGIVITLVGASTGGPFFVFWGAVLWGAIQMIRAGIGLGRTDTRVMDQVRTVSASNKEELDRIAYQQHVSSVQVPPMSLDDFVSMREAMSWSEASSSHSVAHSSGQWLPLQAPASNAKKPRAKLLLWLSVAVVGIGLTAAVVATAVSIGTNADSDESQPRLNAAEFDWYYVADDDPALSRCSDEDGCWAWRIVSPADCLATVTLGFSTSPTSEIEHTFERDVKLDSSEDTSVVVGARLAQGYDYGYILDVQC